MALKGSENVEKAKINIVITGISRGLGKELFELFISKGYNVFGILRNKNMAERLISDLPNNGNVILADLLSDNSIDSMQKVIKEIPIDLLINNAGIGGKSHLIDHVESEEILKLLNIHCLGVFRTTKALKSNLLKAKEPIVINLNSRLGSLTRQNNNTYKNITVSYSYRIAKAAQNMLTICLRSEFRDRIKFISIHPGKMKTDIAQTDADIEPKVTANKILEIFESGSFEEKDGIDELEKEIIEW